jgi:endonuclease/exonuclease/phosphatase (EEP) superfamily protein YafD
MTEIPPARPNRHRRMAVRLVWIAWGIGIAITALGFTAAWIPIFDLINDARPLVALAVLVLFLIAGGLREQGLVRPTASLALLQIGLLLLPWARAADRASAAPPSLRLVTFDLGPGEDNFDQIADFITAAQADAVLLQGVSCVAVDRLIPKLKPIFPNALVPADGCDGQALLAKRAWLAGGQVTTRSRRPLLVWARFQWDRHTFVLTGVHLSGPLAPNEQAADIGRLQAQLATQGPAHIVAGNFNVTPFAWAFAQLQNSGLGQHATYLGNFVATWPARWSVPMLLPDNVLSSDGIASVRLSTGPALGSAHLPLIADIAFVK